MFAIEYVLDLVAAEVGFNILKGIKRELFLMNLPIPLVQNTHPLLKQTRISNDHLESKSSTSRPFWNKDAAHHSKQWGLNTILPMAA